jgi:hypothetical protein
MIVGKKITTFYIPGNANYKQHINKTIKTTTIIIIIIIMVLKH